MPPENQWEYIDNNQENDETSWLFDEVANDFDGVETQEALDDEENLIKTKNIAKEKNIEPYCNNIDDIIVLKNTIYSVDHSKLNWVSQWEMRTMLKSWEIGWEYIWNIVHDRPVLFKDIRNVRSEPYSISGRGSTECSKTARLNAKQFWLIVPQWHASESFTHPPKDNRFVRNIHMKNNNYVNLNNMQNSDDVNFADLEVTSSNGYWHRAAAFKDTLGRRYILDPYVSPYKKNDKDDEGNYLNEIPQPIENYRRKIIQANLYLAPVQAKLPEIEPIPELPYRTYQSSFSNPNITV